MRPINRAGVAWTKLTLSTSLKFHHSSFIHQLLDLPIPGPPGMWLLTLNGQPQWARGFIGADIDVTKSCRALTACIRLLLHIACKGSRCFLKNVNAGTKPLHGVAMCQSKACNFRLEAAQLYLGTRSCKAHLMQ